MTHDEIDRAGWLTTAEAAAYLGYRSPQAIRSLIARGRLTPDGRRGRRGAYLRVPPQRDHLDRRNAITWISRTRSPGSPTRSPGSAVTITSIAKPITWIGRHDQPDRDADHRHQNLITRRGRPPG